jgi:hypothetical protein
MDANITNARIRNNIHTALPAKLKPHCPDTFVPFPEFYVKIENGFVAQKNCFVAAFQRNRIGKQTISIIYIVR